MNKCLLFSFAFLCLLQMYQVGVTCLPRHVRDTAGATTANPLDPEALKKALEDSVRNLQNLMTQGTGNMDGLLKNLDTDLQSLGSRLNALTQNLSSLLTNSTATAA